MIKTIQDNRLYFLFMSVFTIAGGVYWLRSEKVDAILFCCDNRSFFLNEAFKILTHFGEAPAYILIGLVALLFRFRYSLLVAITGITVMVASFSLKTWFAIDRPMALFTKQNLLARINLIDGVELHTGATSFPSGHTMSAFALYSLLIFLLPKRWGYTVLLFGLALLVGISRIYLVQHFWPDVYAGGIFGAMLALAIYSVQTGYPPSSGLWLDQSLWKKKPHRPSEP